MNRVKMDQKFFESKNIIFFDSETYLTKSIPFKMYKIDGGVPFIPSHTHDYIQIWYVLRGAFTHWLNNGKEYKMVKGDLVVLPPFAIHGVKPEEEEGVTIIGCEFLPQFINSKFKYFNRNKDFFDFAYLEPFLVSEDMVRPKLNISGEIQMHFEDMLEEMLEEYNSEEEYYEIFLKGDLLKLLTIIIREYKKGYQSSETKELFDKYRSAIIDSINFIRQNYNMDLHLEAVCKHSMMSKTYFCYIFKSLTGNTFTEYLIRLRIEKALELLISTSMPVTKICFEVGFNDVTHFCRTFKKVVGVSPKQYKNVVLDRDSDLAT